MYHMRHEVGHITTYKNNRQIRDGHGDIPADSAASPNRGATKFISCEEETYRRYSGRNEERKTREKEDLDVFVPFRANGNVWFYGNKCIAIYLLAY